METREIDSASLYMNLFDRRRIRDGTLRELAFKGRAEMCLQETREELGER